MSHPVSAADEPEDPSKSRDSAKPGGNPSELPAGPVEAIEDVLEGFITDPTVRTEAVQRLSFTIAQFRSPYPPTEYLAELEKLVPGGAKHVMDQADAQADHRRGLEARVVNGGEARADRGQWMGLAVAVLFLVAAVVVILLGQPIVGGLIATVDLVALVSVFVLGRDAQKRGIARKDPV